MVKTQRSQRPAPAPRFTVFDFRVIGEQTGSIKDGDNTIAHQVPIEIAQTRADLLNVVDAIAKRQAIRSDVPNPEFIAHIVAKAMGGSIDFDSFAEARRG
jgi:hypothetical protein